MKANTFIVNMNIFHHLENWAHSIRGKRTINKKEWERKSERKRKIARERAKEKGKKIRCRSFIENETCTSSAHRQTSLDCVHCSSAVESFDKLPNTINDLPPGEISCDIAICNIHTDFCLFYEKFTSLLEYSIWFHFPKSWFLVPVFISGNSVAQCLQSKTKYDA